KLILNQAKSANYHTIYLNFQSVESSRFSELDKFLRWFCANVGRELGLKPQLDDYWDEDLFGSLVSCKTYFQSYLLEQIQQPLVLALDNLDRIFDYPDIAQDFLPMLRYWHEEANNLPLWQNLRLIMANST
ncbi:MAG: AAA-like domain-containing protein, partial [Microcystaceae cyanobacterium]